MSIPKNFYVVALESGSDSQEIPTWANTNRDPLSLSRGSEVCSIKRVSVKSVPHAYQLLNVLSEAECGAIIQLTELLGYLPDAAVSLPRYIRHNDNIVWVADEATVETLWARVDRFCNQHLEFGGGKRALGINARFRFYRYGSGDYFKLHTDGAWPGSAVVDGELVANAYPDRYSLMTFLVFLNDGYSGGATRFFINGGNNSAGQPFVEVRTPAGAVLCFPHGLHPSHCVHSSEPIETGCKYILRTDLLFEL